MVKLAKQRAWVETALDTIEGLTVNTDLGLDFETQVSKHGTPVATAFSPKFNAVAEGDVLKYRSSLEVWIVERKDGDHEGLMESIILALENVAYPDFYEDGDVSHSPGDIREYDGQIWDLSADADSGNIIIRLTITLNYIYVSER